jgi:hypothetical protein
LRRLKDVYGREIAIFGFAFIDISQRGVGGAEIDPDLHVGNSRLSETLDEAGKHSDQSQFGSAPH